MKAMKKGPRMYISRAIYSLLLLFTLAVVFSCSPSAGTPSIDSQQMSTNDAVITILTDEIDDIVLQALNNSATSAAATNGRVEVISDDRLTCSNISIVFSGIDPADKAFGKVTITYPQDGSCVDKKGNVRKGTIVAEWTGSRWYRAGSTLTITLSNYSANGIVITGKRTLSAAAFNFTTSNQFQVIWDVAANHTLTWPDASSATLNVTYSRQWDHINGSETFSYTNPPTTIGNYAMQGMNRHGKNFNMVITTPLVYYYSCIVISKNYMPVYGVKVLTNLTDNVSMTINYGTLYNCDNLYTLTTDKASVDLRSKNNSSDD